MHKYRYNCRVPFRIRQFQKGDFHSLWQIDQACFTPELAYSQPELAFYMRRPGAFTLVADMDSDAAALKRPFEGIVGFIVAESRRETGHIITIDVVSDSRGSGVGSLLLKGAEDRFLTEGAAEATLETPVDNEVAIRFYKRHGYVATKKVAGYYAKQLDALVMTKILMTSKKSGSKALKA